MRYEATATCLSWIPPTAVEGVFSLPFGLGVAHFDQPPPDQLPEIEALLSADAIRFANQLHAWIEVQDGQIIAHGMSGGGHLGSTTVRLRSHGLTFAGVALPDLVPPPEVPCAMIWPSWTSIHACSWLANRIASADSSASISCS